MNVKDLEECCNEKIEREMSNFIHTLEDRNQNASLTTFDSINAPKSEIEISSIIASSRRDATSVTANSERGELIGITASFENASENSNVRHISNVNDETGNNILDEVKELSVRETRFERQPHTHHSYAVDFFWIKVPFFNFSGPTCLFWMLLYTSDHNVSYFRVDLNRSN